VSRVPCLIQAVLRLLSVYLMVSVGVESARAQDLNGLGDLPGGSFFSSASAISADGTVVVGSSSSAAGIEAFRWSAADGLEGLGGLAGGRFFSDANGVNADGTVIVGTSEGAAGREAFRWTRAAGMQGLGSLPIVGGGTGVSFANGVNADGTVVVGRSQSVNGFQAFIWANGVMTGLGDLPGGGFDSRATGVSADGKVVVGASESAHGEEAFRWTLAGGMEGLGDLAGGGFSSAATAISDDGNVIVGASESGRGFEAFRWTRAGGMQPLGTIPGGAFESEASDVNADGSVIVGEVEDANGDSAAFYWTQARGMEALTTVLARAGVNVAGIVLEQASGVSADGLVVVGSGDFGNGGEAYLARVGVPPTPPVTPDPNTPTQPNGRPPRQDNSNPGPTAGLITFAELARTLSQTSHLVEAATTANFFDLMSLATIATKFQFQPGAVSGGPTDGRPAPAMQLGAHSKDESAEPAAARVSPFAFAVGALYLHDQDEFDARRGSGVAGFGFEVLPGVTIGAGLNTAYSEGRLPWRGSYDLASIGAGAFVSYRPAATGFQFVATGVARHLEFDIERAYQNGNATDVSRGETDGASYGALFRAGYALPLFERFRVMPFAEFALTHTEVSGYTETGGAFPATFETLSATERRVRLGAELRGALSADMDGWLSVAWNHRLERDAPRVTGALTGLFAFDLPGAGTERDGIDVSTGLTWTAAPGVQLLGEVTTSFATGAEPTVGARFGARIALSGGS
jgi:probable HAF family extracellular repeat protein